MGDMAVVKVLKNALCFIMGYLVAMEYVLRYLIGAFFCMIHRHIDCIGTINVCTDLRSIGTKLMNLKTCKNRMFYLTSRDAKTVRRTSWGLWILLIGILKSF